MFFIITNILLLFQNELFSQYIPESLLKEAYMRMQYDIRASHIIIRLNENASPKDTLAAYNKITALRNRILKGEAFTQVAYEESEDPSARDREDVKTKKNVKGTYGDLGYFTVLDMIYPFETAAYNTPVGQISMPIRTIHGYHLIKVTERKPAMGKVTVAHIFIEIPEGIAAEEMKNYKDTIDEVYSKLIAGYKWEDLVTFYSDDKVTVSKGGQLPSFGVNRMVPEFIIAISNLKNPGDISEPVHTIYGWHIIKLLDRIPVGTYAQEYSSLKQRILNDSRYIKKTSKKKYDISLLFNSKKDTVNINTKPIVLSIAGEDITLDALMKMYSENNSEMEIDEYMDLFINFKLKLKQAIDLGLDTTSTFKRELQQYRDELARKNYNDDVTLWELKDVSFKVLIIEYYHGMLLWDITNSKIWLPAIKDTNGRKDFYEKNKSKYTGRPFNLKDTVIIKDYQNYLEKEWVKQLRETYSFKINNDVLVTSYGQYAKKSQNNVTLNDKSDKGLIALKEIDSTYYDYKIGDIKQTPSNINIIAKSYLTGNTKFIDGVLGDINLTSKEIAEVTNLLLSTLQSNNNFSNNTPSDNVLIVIIESQQPYTSIDNYGNVEFGINGHLFFINKLEKLLLYYNEINVSGTELNGLIKGFANKANLLFTSWRNK